MRGAGCRPRAMRRNWWRTSAMPAAEASVLSDQVTGRICPAASFPALHRLARSGVTARAIPIPIRATPLARTFSAVSCRVMPPVSISGMELVVAKSVANSRK